MVAATVKVAVGKVEVEIPIIVAGVTVVVEAVEARLGLVVARDAVKEATPAEATGVVAAALGEDTVDEGTVREAVQLDTTATQTSSSSREGAANPSRLVFH